MFVAGYIIKPNSSKNLSHVTEVITGNHSDGLTWHTHWRLWHAHCDFRKDSFLLAPVSFLSVFGLSFWEQNNETLVKDIRLDREVREGKRDPNLFTGQS